MKRGPGTLHGHATPGGRSRPTSRLPSPSTLSLVVEPYYSDGQVSLYLGDCLEITEWLAADVLCTDPPYGIGWERHSGGNGKTYGSGHAGIKNDQDTSARDAVLAMWGDRPGVVFGSFYAPAPMQTKQWLVFAKGADAGLVGSTTGFRRDTEPIFLTGAWPQRTVRWSSLIATARGTAGTAMATGHPHTKPLDVMEALISACPPGVIADPFAGSGSTLLAARNLGRQAIGVELVEAYCEVAAKRLQQMCLELGV